MREVLVSQSDIEDRKRARGDAKYKICGGCSSQFQHDIRNAATDLGETTEYFVFRAAWDRFRAHETRKKESEEGRKFIAFQRFLADKKANPLLQEFLEKLIDQYLPRHKP